MSDVGTDGRAWVAEQLFGPDPCPRPTGRRSDPDGLAPAASPTAAVDLDAPSSGRTDPPAVERDSNPGAGRASVGLAALFGVAVITIVAALVGTGGDGQAAAPAAGPPTAVVQPAPAPPSAAAPADRDEPIGYTASATCPAGSTSAAALTDARRGSAWTCVRGQPGARVDGQVLRVDLGGSYVLTALSITPGWVAKTPGAADEWLQHRVVSRLQYVFDDADRTIFTQDTGDVHGPVTTALPRPVLASRATVIVLQTARPPASPPASTSGVDVPPGFGDSVFDPFEAPPPADATVTSDPPSVPAADGDDAPVDATFSITALSFFGHPPR